MSRAGAVALLSLLALLATGACAESDPTSEPDLLVVDTGELEVVTEEVRFARGRDIAVDARAIWVLDDAPPHVTRIPLDGSSPVVQMGDRGGGPGELTRPVAMQPASGTGGGVWVWDAGAGRAVAFDQSGTPVGSEAVSDARALRTRPDIREVTYADPLRVRRIGAHVVTTYFPRRVDRTADVALGSIGLSGIELAPDVELVRLGDLAGRGASALRELAALPLWDACDGALTVWSPAERRVTWLGPSGDASGTAPVPVQPPEITVGHVETYLTWMARLELGPAFDRAGIDLGAMAHATRDRFETEGPAVTDVRCESGRAAWLQLFDMSSDPLGHGSRWIRVEAGGTARAYRFPERLAPVVFTEGGGGYGFWTEARGLQRLVRWPAPIATSDLSSPENGRIPSA